MYRVSDLGSGNERDSPTKVKNSCIALVDCNSFYASCESVFEPRLWTTPLIVLSSNDGTVVALNTLAKKLEGVEKGKPFFQLHHLMHSGHLAVKSSNFALYGDMSARVMQTLIQFTPQLEVYSIDESFLTFHHIAPQFRTEYAHHIRSTVKQYTGIPISIGIGETKTLAKVANRTAKKIAELEGVLDITSSPDLQAELLATLPVGEVWGIGSRWNHMLISEGIDTALKLRNLPDYWVKKRMGIVGLRTLLELRGLSCLPLEVKPRQRKSTMVSRTFGYPVRHLSELQEAVATFADRAGRKLRREGLTAGKLSVFVSSNRFQPDYYSNSASRHLLKASNHTLVLLSRALPLTAMLWRDGVELTKAGVVLTHLMPQDTVQLSLFDDEQWEEEKLSQLTHLVDDLNKRYGNDAVRYAAMGTTQRWQTRAKYRSPRWTTRWDEIPIVKC